jgi:hypothetical protein
MAISARDDKQRYRLAPSEINALISAAGEKYGKQEPVELEIISSVQGSLNHFVRYHTIHRLSKCYKLFPLCKDAGTPTNEPNLPFIGDLVAKYIEKNPYDQSMLILPMRMCRGYYQLSVWIPYVKRKHVVLVTLDLAANQIELYDPGNKFSQWTYPDKLVSVAGKAFLYDPAKHYHAYGVQVGEDYSCGQYVHQYLLKFLETANPDDFAKIRLQLKQDYVDKIAYLSQYIPHYVTNMGTESILLTFDSDNEGESDSADTDGLVDSFTKIEPT